MISTTNYSKHIFQKLTLKGLPSLTKLFSTIVGISSNEENLEIKFGDKKEDFPLVWLRDNCRCEHCFHPGSQSRIINWNNFNVNVKAKSVETTQRNDGVTINWEDNHESDFSFEWLKERSFIKENQETFLKETYRPMKTLWAGKDFLKIVRRYDYKDVMTNDEKCYNWLRDLACYGAVFLENAPLDANEYKKVANKIAFIRKTHYGDEFHVVAKPGTSNVAYLSSLLQLHTDLPYYEYTPGVTMLHCLKQTEGQGGENLLTDVFYVAEKLRKDNKEVFDTLSKVQVNWLDIGEEDGIKYHTLFRAPVISLDTKGNVEKVYHSVPQRDSRFTVNLDNVKPWYKALRIFVDLINTHACQFKTKPGDILAFDNLRLVHGRLSYEDSEQNRRHLVGFYLDWDEIYSKMRILKQDCAK